MFYSYSSFYCSPFSSGGEPNNNVISVWYKFLNKHLLIITLAKRTWGGGNKINVTHSQGFTDSEEGDWGVRGPRGAWEAGEKLFGGRGYSAINGGSPGCGRTGYGKQEVLTPCPPPSRKKYVGPLT